MIAYGKRVRVTVACSGLLKLHRDTAEKSHAAIVGSMKGITMRLLFSAGYGSLQ